MTTRDAVADRIDKVHDELLVRGWCQHVMVNEDEEVCPVGAIYAAQGVDIRPDTTRRWSLDLLSAIVHDVLAFRIYGLYGPPSIPAWNDAPDRTLDDVLDTLRHAAKAVREGEHDYFIEKGQRDYNRRNHQFLNDTAMVTPLVGHLRPRLRRLGLEVGKPFFDQWVTEMMLVLPPVNPKALVVIGGLD